MKRRKVWISLVVTVFLLGGFLVAYLEHSRIISGLLRGEPFHRGRPVSYWREVLRKCGQRGEVPKETARQFRDGGALAVLLECADDPDPYVRWPAVRLLGEDGNRTDAALAAAVAALEDEHPEVRHKAIAAISCWGPQAHSAVPALQKRLEDTNPEVAATADMALWEVDAEAARAASGWMSFRSPEHGFSVSFPGEVDREKKELELLEAVTHSFMAWHWAGKEKCPTRYLVAVTEYPEEFVKGRTEGERFDATRETVLAMSGGTLLSERTVTLGGRVGREQAILVGGKSTLRSRLFWSGRRMYHVGVTYAEPRYHNRTAADYFLDSFRLETDPTGNGKGGTKPEREKP